MNRRGELLDPCKADTASAALIRARGVGEPVAYYPVAPRQCRANQIIEMHAARSEHEERFRLRSHVLIAPVEHDLTDALRERRAAGLASHQDRKAAGPQAVAHEACDCRFASPFDAFECD